MTDNAVHVCPISDLFEHDIEHDDACPCGPTVEPVERRDGLFGWLYIHHSLDGREKREQALAELQAMSPDEEPSVDEVRDRTKRARKGRSHD